MFWNRKQSRIVSINFISLLLSLFDRFFLSCSSACSSFLADLIAIFRLSFSSGRWVDYPRSLFPLLIAAAYHLEILALILSSACLHPFRMVSNIVSLIHSSFVSNFSSTYSSVWKARFDWSFFFRSKNAALRFKGIL